MSQRLSSAHKSAIPTQEILRIPPRSHQRSKSYPPGEHDPYPLVWSEKQKRTRRQPGSISSDDTSSSSWSTQKPSSIPIAPKPTPPRKHSPQTLMYKSPQGIGTNTPNRPPSLQQQEPYLPSHHTTQSALPSSTAEDNAALYRYIEEQRHAANTSDDASDHAIWILLWLSFLDPFMSLFSAFFSLLSTLCLTITYPILPLCHHHRKDTSTRTTTFSTLVIRTLAPLFRWHLRLLCAPSVDEAHTFDFSPSLLVLVHLVSPLLSIGVSLATWVAAAFWLFALMMGNPDGTERGDDGRATVLAVRDWWERFHLYAVR